ncbi:hypothetical protein JX265_003656 [Neoarthrinium moseri]|uniref:Chitin-binding type-1 domain-containing protein n=1 Tax=Neoarthrinium moseri TaxID=1658444 RepID=A0A9P9WSL1_9PEZI|nr:uncharacterized protein JN550_002401 [Neoarthrinium moseri]KAI1854020.1 hypothetical protein JX266_001161 [Neoarthrinium moseri]KAI1874972.1 hypothetical protein JN550_002401 [Neoarthrinium moseri]KAI1877648.1 hypothetical protein JX265_003656 [Neoarthrinium moseri]
MKSSVFCWLLPALAASQTTTTSSLPAWATGVETEDGTCGGTTGWVCTPTWGACCSKDGLCGRSAAFCGEGCQPLAGNCNAPPAPKPGPGSPSPDGSCGGTNQFNCTGATYGACCSSSGYCGDTTGHCGAGCQTLFGTCATVDDSISTDGQCGSNGKTCEGSAFGDCCSSGGWCGGSETHCGAGCQEAFGNCTSNGNNPPSGDISIDGNCGSNGKTCQGSAFGDCCSSSGFCGGSDAFCGAGCQTGFGVCSAAANVTTDGACGKNGKTPTVEPVVNRPLANALLQATSLPMGPAARMGRSVRVQLLVTAAQQMAFAAKPATIVPQAVKHRSGHATLAVATFQLMDHVERTARPVKVQLSEIVVRQMGFVAQPPRIARPDAKRLSNGKTCKGSSYGDCCSANGYCGKTADHCGAGCNTAFGTCNSGSSGISTDGLCGILELIAVKDAKKVPQALV